MKPLEVPMTSETVTLRQVGRPKLRLPTSEKTCPVIFFNFVHRTTSHGACGVSVPSSSGRFLKTRLLDIDDWRECGERKAGDWTRGDDKGDGERREEKRRSKGCKDVGRCGRSELCDTGTLLPGEERPEPCTG